MEIIEYLKKHQLDLGLIKVFEAFSKATLDIANEIKYSDGGKSGMHNASGEEQLALDIRSDRIMEDYLSKSEVVFCIASEEQEASSMINPDGQYSVAYDPLDGSSLVNVNFSIGSILGIYKAKNFIGRTPREMVGAAYSCYGPRITIVLSFGAGTHEFTYQDEQFILTRENLQISEKAKNFAPGNLRACKFEKWYNDLLSNWILDGYTLRYSGAMVADLNHILVKGQGIFTYPGYSEIPEGKLRLLIECGPMAYLVENAGGVSSDGKISILDKSIHSLHQRTPIFIGSKEEVLRINGKVL